jgi:hypothetical protein
MSSKAADARESDQRRLVTSESSSAFQARATAGGAAATTPSEALAPQLQPRKKSSPLKKALWFLRGIAAFFGAIIFWVGLWNIFANGFIAEETWWWNVINIIIGVVVLVGTNTMGTLAGHDPNEDNFRLDDRRALWPQKMAASVRGFFALSASVILWKGFWLERASRPVAHRPPSNPPALRIAGTCVICGSVHPPGRANCSS